MQPGRTIVMLINIHGSVVYFKLRCPLLTARNGNAKIQKSSVLPFCFTLSDSQTSSVGEHFRKSQGVTFFKLFHSITFGNIPGNWKGSFVSGLTLRYISSVIFIMWYCCVCMRTVNVLASLLYSHSVAVSSFNVTKRNSVVFSQPLCLLIIQKQSDVQWG